MSRVSLLVAGLIALAAVQSAREFETLPFAPKHVICYRTAARLNVDGRLDEAAWRAAPFWPRSLTTARPGLYRSLTRSLTA